MARFFLITITFGLLLAQALTADGDGSEGNTDDSQGVTEPAKELRAVTLLDPPFVMLSGTGGEFKGYAVDILNEAMANMADEYAGYSLQIHSDATYGMEESPGKWSGLLGAVQNESADIALAAFTLTSKRAAVVEFSHSIMTSGFRVLYKEPESWYPGQAMATMLRPFSAGLWVLIILMFVVVSLGLYAIGRFSPFEDPAFVGKASTFEGLTLPNSFLYVFSTLVLQGYTSVPKSFSGRVLTGVWWVFVILTIGAYIAGLTVILFRTNPELRTLKFATLDELSRQTDVGLMVVQGSSAHQHLKTSKDVLEGRLLAMLTANRDDLLMKSTKAAIDRMMESDGKLALLMDGSAAKYLTTQEPCDKMVIGERLGEQYFSFACRNTSDVCTRLDTEIIAMREKGRLSALEQKWFHSGCLKDKPNNYIFEGVPFFDTFAGEPDYIMPMTITVTRFSAAFVLLVLGVVIAAGTLGAEIWWARKRGTAVPRRLGRDGRDDDMHRIDNEFHDEPSTA